MSIIKKPKTAIGIWLTTFILVLAIVATGTVSWFITNTEVSISSPSDENLAVQINAGDLEVSVSYKSVTKDEDDPDWYYGKFTEYSPYSEQINITAASPQFIDVTGDGNTLWYPITVDSDDNPLYSNPDNWEEVTDVVGYTLTLYIKFKTSQTMDIYLDNDSFVQGMEDIITGAMVRSTAYGPYSTDGVCAAVRVAFLEVDGEEETLKSVWIPNDTYRLTYDEETELYNYTLTGERESEYIYYVKNSQDAMEKHTYSGLEIASGSVMVGNYSLADSTYNVTNGAPSLLSFEANGTVQEKVMKVRIWFEGTDAESVTYLDGGKVKYKLAFAGINKNEATDEVQTKVANCSFYNDALRYNGEACFEPVDGVSQVMYSYDGIEWTTYGTGAPANMKKGTYDLYIKSVETATNKSSSVKYLPNITNTIGIDENLVEGEIPEE